MAPYTIIPDLLEPLETKGSEDIQDQKVSKEIKEFLEEQDLRVHRDQVVSKGLQGRLSLDTGPLGAEELRVNQDTPVALL